MIWMVAIGIIEVAKLILVFYILFGARVKNRRLVWPLGAMLLIYIAILAAYPDVTISVIDVLFFAVVLYMYDGLFVNKLIACLLSWLSLQIVDNLAILIIAFALDVNPFDLIDDRGTMHTACSAVSLPLLVLCCLFMGKCYADRRSWLEKRERLWRYICFFLLGIGILTVTGIYVIQAYYRAELRPSGRVYIISAAAILMTIVPATILIGNNLKLSHENIRQAELMRNYQKQNSMQMSYYTDMMSRDEELRAFRHDFRHHLNMLDELMTDGRVDEARDYLNRMRPGSHRGLVRELVYTGNRITDASIYGVLSAPEHASVKFTCRGHLPQTVGIDAADLCILMSNAVENAAHACIRSDSPEIIFTSKMYEDMLYIKIENTYSEVNAYSLQNAEHKPGSEHGYGIPNMKAVVKKYHGTMEYEVNERYVVLDIEVMQRSDM